MILFIVCSLCVVTLTSLSCNTDLCVSFSVDGRPVHGSKEWLHKPVLVMCELVLVLAFKTHWFVIFILNIHMNQSWYTVEQRFDNGAMCLCTLFMGTKERLPRWDEFYSCIGLQASRCVIITRTNAKGLVC